ncbi:hypothetical protein ACSSS7_002520 [Eimeria intestinalis]
MDARWMPRRSTSKTGGHDRRAWPDFSSNQFDGIPIADLGDLHHNMNETGFDAHASQARRVHAGDLEGTRQVEYNYWQQQVEEHQQQLHSHQKRWHMQRQEWLEQSASWDEQQARHRNMRRKSVKKPEKPRWTCLEQLKKTLTVDSAEEEPGPPPQAPSHPSSHSETIEEEKAFEREHRTRSRHRPHGHLKRPHKSHERREYHKVRWSGLEQECEEEAVEFQTREEATQQLDEQKASAGAASPRFGLPESPASQESTDSVVQRSPVFGSLRASPKVHRGKINYIHPWTDGTESFPPSTSTVATAMDSPGRSSRSREHQHQGHLQEAAFLQDIPSWRQESASQHCEAGFHNQRRARSPQISRSFRSTPQKHVQEAERQVKWRSALRQQLDEGLREALSHDLLEFQKEAFFGSRGKKAAQPSLKLLEEGVKRSEERVEEDVEEEIERRANSSDASDKQDVVQEGHEEAEQHANAIKVSAGHNVVQEGHDETAECAAGELDAAEEEVEPEYSFDDSPGGNAEESEELRELQDSNLGDVEEELPSIGAEELEQQQEERHEEEEISECLSAESEGTTKVEKTAVDGVTTEEKLLQLEEELPITEPTEEQVAEGEEGELAAGGDGEPSDIHEGPCDAETTQEIRVPEPVEEDAAEVGPDQGEFQPSSAVDAAQDTRNSGSPEGVTVTDQLTLEALQALSLGMLRPQSQPTWEHQQSASRLPGEWIVGTPSTGGSRIPAAMAFSPQQPQLRTGTDMLYSWLAGTARLQQQLLMQSAGMVAAPLTSSEVSRDSCASSVSSGVPPDFQWWTPSTEGAASASSCQESREEAITTASPEANQQGEEADNQGKNITTILSPPSEIWEGAEEHALVVWAPTEEALQASPEKSTAPEPSECRAPGETHSEEQGECSPPAARSPGSEDVVADAEAPKSDSDACHPSDSKIADEASKNVAKTSQATRKQGALLIRKKAAAAAAAPTLARGNEAAEPREGVAPSETADLQSHPTADASKSQAAPEKINGSSLLSLSPKDLDNFERLQSLRAERAAAKHAQSVARTSPSTFTTQVGSSLVQAKHQHLESEASHVAREVLPAPPPARAGDRRHQIPAPVRVEDVHYQQPTILQLDQRKTEWHAEPSQGKQLQQELQAALRQQLRQPQPAERQQAVQVQHFQGSQEKGFEQLEGSQLQQHQKGRERVTGSTARSTPRVRFSDEAVKNNELKEQLRKQAKELRKLRLFRDEQQALHQETERHLDTLHKELQNLATENVCLLHDQKQMGLGAQKAAFRLLLLNALQQRKADRQDAAVSPRNEEAAALEHFLKQNKELEQMQWQLQQLRHSVVSSQAVQHRDQRLVRELQEKERQLQEENEQLKSKIDAIQQGHAAVLEAERLKQDEKQQSNAQLEIRRETFEAEQHARAEAEEQLRETLEVMQLLKQCLKEQKERVASLEKQLEELQQQQEQQSSGRELAANTQSTALLDMLAREAAREETQELQGLKFFTSTDAQEGSPDKNLAHFSPLSKKVETAETGIQAGNPMPYSKSIPAEAEQQQQASRLAAQQQALIARLKSALSTQAKAFSKDKAYYQQLVLQLQERIAELERYQHQLLLHVQQQQHALQTRAGMATVHYQPFAHEAPPPFDATEAARAAAAAVLQHVATTAAAVQKAVREVADQPHAERREEMKDAAVREESPNISNNADTDDWLKLLADAIEDDDQKKIVITTEAQKSHMAASLALEHQGNTGAAFPTAAGGTGVLNLLSVTTPAAREHAVFALPDQSVRGAEQQQTTSVPSVTSAGAPTGHASPEVLQQILLRQFQEKFGERIHQHLEKLQQTLNSPRLQSFECQSERSVPVPPSEDKHRGAGQQLTTSLASEREQGRCSEDAGLQQSQQQSAEQRLFLLLQQHRHSHFAASTPTYMSPMGTVESVQIPAAAPAEIELQAKPLKRQDANRSPLTSTTASTVVADFCTEENSGGMSLAISEAAANVKESGEDLPGARQRVQQFRQMLRQQGLLS